MMAVVKALSGLTMSAPYLMFPTLADADFNGSDAAIITPTTIRYVDGVPEQGNTYTFAGTFSFTRDPLTGEVSDVSGTVHSIQYEFVNSSNPEEGAQGGYEIDQISMAVSAFNAGDSSVPVAMFGGADIVEGSDRADGLFGFAGNDTLRGGGGTDWLDGGEGADFMAGGKFNDTYIVDNERDVVIEFPFEGSDKVLSFITHRLQANVETLYLQGTSPINGVGNELGNYITGTAAKNYLYGNDGDDIISGGFGNDILTGGAGRDNFNFAGAPNTTTNADKVLDFTVADDHFSLSHNAYQKLAVGSLSDAAFRINKTGYAQDATDRIIYESDTGELYYDSNGNQPGGSTLFSIIDKDLPLTRWDFLIV